MKIRRVEIRIYNSPTPDTQHIYTFSYPETKIDFRVSLREENQPDDCYVKIYGVKKETYSLFKVDPTRPYSEKQLVEVYYGVDDSLTLCYDGYIDKAVYGFDGGSQVLTLLINKNTRTFKNMIKSISFNDEQTIKGVVDRIGKEFGYNVEYEKIEDFYNINIGRIALTGNLENMLKSVLPKEYDFYMGSTHLHIYKNPALELQEITLYLENGLLNYPTEDTRGESIHIKSILIPMIQAGIIIKVPIDEYWYSRSDTGKYRRFIVRNYSSVFSNGIGHTEMECYEEV